MAEPRCLDALAALAPASQQDFLENRLSQLNCRKTRRAGCSWILVAAIALGSSAARADEPVVEGPAPPVDPVAAEAAARAEHDAQEAAEREMLRGELAQLRADIEGERNYRAALAASLASRVDTLTITVDNPNATPTVAAARTGLSLTGFVQSDLQLRQSSQDQLDAAGVPLDQETFQIRRARLKAVVERDWVAGALELDGNTVNGPQVRILNAEASLKWPPARGGIPLVMATIGAFKIRSVTRSVAERPRAPLHGTLDGRRARCFPANTTSGSG